MDVMSSKNLRSFLTVDSDIHKENLMHAVNFMQVKYFWSIWCVQFQNLFVHLILAPKTKQEWLSIQMLSIWMKEFLLEEKFKALIKFNLNIDRFGCL